MKINQIINETTVAGGVAPVVKPMGETQKRPTVNGLEPAEKVMSGKTKKKGPYQNSLSEGKMKDLSLDLTGGKDGLSDAEFKKKYGKSKEEMRKAMKEKPETKKVEEGKKDFLGKLQKNIDKSNKNKKDTEEKVKQHQQDEKKKVEEAELKEDDIIVLPGSKMKRKTGFVPHGQSRVDHEVEMARSDVLATMKNAKAIYELLKNRSEEEGIEGWVQEKLIKANDYLNAVKEYYDEKMMQEMTGGVIAGGGVGEGVAEGKEDLSQYSTERLKAYLEKHSGGGVPTFGTGALLKRIQAELKRRQQGVAEGQLDEKAVSKAQQRFMGMVHAVQKGEMKAPSKKIASAAKGMTKKAGHEFAATKHKGLPEKVKKD